MTAAAVSRYTVTCPGCGRSREVGYERHRLIRTGAVDGRCRWCAHGDGQERVLDALKTGYAANGGWPLHVREIGDLAGIVSLGGVHAHLWNLRARGLVEKGPAAKDGWRPV